MQLPRDYASSSLTCIAIAGTGLIEVASSRTVYAQNEKNYAIDEPEGEA
jgi:hypothetical protein